MIAYMDHKICHLEVYNFPKHFYGNGQQSYPATYLRDFNLFKNQNFKCVAFNS